MSKPFEKALKAFLAAKYDGQELGEVRIRWNEGCDSEGSYWEAATFNIEIFNLKDGWIIYATNKGAADLLHEMLAWEDDGVEANEGTAVKEGDW